MFATAFVFILPFLTTAHPQDSPHEGPFFLDDIQLWHADGSTTGPHDLILKNGRIQELSQSGEQLQRPPKAKFVQAPEGESWIAYPGLFHGNIPSEFSEPDHPYGGNISDPTTGPIPTMELGNFAPLRGWETASDKMVWDPEAAKSWRLQGFTSGQIIPARGLARGWSSWVSLNGKPLGEALLKRQGLPVFSLRSHGSGYPGTAMASLATLRQAMLDADQDSRISNPALASFQSTAPRVFLANTAREIRNVLDLQAEFSPQSETLLLGGKDAWRLSDRLLREQVGVLFVLDLPDAPEDKDDEKANPESRSWWETPHKLNDEKRRLHTEKVEAFLKLQASGVPCALIPSGSAKQFQEDLEQLLKAGIHEETLHRALHQDLYALLQSEAPHWATGQPSDFFLHRNAWTPGKPNLAWVFADHRGWELEEGEASSETKVDASLEGDWLVSLNTPMGENEFGLEIRVKGNTVYLFDSEDPKDREEAEEVSMDGNSIRFQFQPPGMPMDFSADLILKGNEGKGTLDSKFGEMPCTLVRLTDVPATENEETKEEESTLPSDPETPDSQEDSVAIDPLSGHPAWLIEVEADRIPTLNLTGDVFFRGATLYPMTGTAPFQGDLLIQNGVITEVGSSLTCPPDIPIVTAKELHITPAILDAHSHLALAAINEGTVSITAECRIGDMIQPRDVGIWRAAAGGTALVQSLHGSANPIGGQAAVWELDYFQEDASHLLYPGAKQGIKFALGENVKQSNWESSWGKRFPNSRVGVQGVYRRAFTAAQEYKKERVQHEEGLAPQFRRDVRLEVLADILDGEIHIQCHSYRADELLMFLDICKEFGIPRPTFQHVLEGYKVAPELAAYGAMASTFSDWWAYKFEVRDAIPWNVSIMEQAGVTVSINSDSDEMIRRLNTEAAKGMRYGNMDWETALATATRNPAIQLRLEDHLGTLEPGKDGTLSIWSAPPLTNQAQCKMTLARGRLLYQWNEAASKAWEDYSLAVTTWANAHREDVGVTPQRQTTLPNSWTKNGQGLAYFIHDAVIHPVSSEPYKGSVIVENGQILFAGKSYTGPLPANVNHIYAKGQHLYPGFINAGDMTGLVEIAAVRASRDDMEIGDYQPDLSFATAIHADSAHHQVTRLNGITHVLVRGTRGTISGQAALIQLDGVTTEDMVVTTDLGLVLRFPRAKKPKEGKEPEEPKGLEELNRWFDEALEYGTLQDRMAEHPLQSWNKDLRMQALVPYARGEKPILIEADSLWNLMAARTWVKERQLSVIWQGGRDAWKVAGILGADGAKVVVGQVHQLPGQKNDPFDAPYRNAGILKAAGCQIAFRTNDPEFARNLPYQAATAGTWGLGQEATLHALTLGAAEVLGVDAYTGSIEAGKSANFFLCHGDPTGFKADIQRMWIAGKEVPLTSKQTALRDRYLKRLKTPRK